MATIYDLKPRFQALLRPVCGALARAGVTANQVTVAAALLSAAGGGVILWQPEARWPLLALPVVLFLRMALNAIDGMLAREHDMKSRLGAVLNELGDVVADIVLYLPLAAVPGITPWPVIGLVMVGILVEMTGVVGVQIGASRRYDGPVGKSDRAFVFGLLAFLLGIGIGAGIWIDILLMLALVLSGFTTINRARGALAEAAGGDK
ncbi:MAG: CDP-alcohol phosphatidyltransferase family protein [Alphaproteobacteria bacterium]|nr:CDP-alcohol phosphatidyltransferase family protein [Alphaproteobacteria bacterium]